MPFRDDREALQARLAEAESQRDEAHAQKEEMSKELAAWPARLAREGAKRSLEGARPRFPISAVLLAGVGLVGFVVGFLLARRDAPALLRQLNGVREISDMYEHEAEVARARAASFESELALERAARQALEAERDAARPTPPATSVGTAAQGANAVAVEGTVSRVRGPAPAARGQRCTLVAIRLAGECTVVVDCADRVVYGGEGSAAECAFDGQTLARATDGEPSSVDGDPILELETATKRLRIRDASPEWEMEIRIE